VNLEWSRDDSGIKCESGNFMSLSCSNNRSFSTNQTYNANILTLTLPQNCYLRLIIKEHIKRFKPVDKQLVAIRADILCTLD